MNREEAIAATRNVIRFRHMSIKTERSYIGWLQRYISWCSRYPAATSREKITGFLSDLVMRSG